MDNNVFIDTTTFDVVDSIPSVFIVDKKIATAVANLNMRGYITKASCSGHNEIKFMEFANCDISFLEEVQKNKHCIVKEIRKDNFDYWAEVLGTSIYISFDDNYFFEYLPGGFEQEEDGTIRHTIEFYNNEMSNARRNSKEIDLEINMYCNKLTEWTKTLENLKTKGK